MNIANVLEGGLKNGKTLGLVQEAITLLNKKPAKKKKTTMNHTALFKEIQAISGRKGLKPNKAIKQVRKLLANTGYLGLSGVGKNKNTIVRGGLLGAAAGLVSIFSESISKSEQSISNGDQPGTGITYHTNNKLLTVTLYTVGGILAGTIIKKLSKNKRLGKWVKKNKSQLLGNLKNLNLN